MGCWCTVLACPPSALVSPLLLGPDKGQQGWGGGGEEGGRQARRRGGHSGNMPPPDPENSLGGGQGARGEGVVGSWMRSGSSIGCWVVAAATVCKLPSLLGGGGAVGWGRGGVWSQEGGLMGPEGEQQQCRLVGGGG